MKGGYQLINFLGKHLSGDATTVTGVYKALSRSGKAVRIAGLNLSGTMMPEANVNVDIVDDTYIFHVYGYRVEIAPGDQVSISQSDTYDELVEQVSQINRDLAEVTSVVVTSDYTGFVNKQVKYKVKNKIVVLSGYFDVTAQLPNNGIIFNNLPAEVNDEVVMFIFGKMNSTNIYTGRMPVAGNVYLDSAIPVGTDYYVQASYFTK